MYFFWYFVSIFMLRTCNTRLYALLGQEMLFMYTENLKTCLINFNGKHIHTGKNYICIILLADKIIGVVDCMGKTG